MASSQTNTGDVLRRLGLADKAREGYEQAIATRERLVQENPEVLSYRSDLAASLRRRGLIRLDRGDHAGAATDTRRALEIRQALSSPSGEDSFESACCHATLAAIAGRDGSGVLHNDALRRGRQGHGRAQKSRKPGLSWLNKISPGIGPRPAPRPPRFSAVDDGCGDADRTVCEVKAGDECGKESSREVEEFHDLRCR